MTAVDPTIYFPIETRPEDATRDLKRRNAALAKEQDKREPLVNSIEHNATVFVADVEKVAATTKFDADGHPVFRRTYADNGEGIPFDTMALLLRHPGTSSKPQDVFEGNHGMGVTVANGFNNPYGMPVISKTADRENPHMAVFKIVKDTDGKDVGSLVPFWVTDEDDESDEDDDESSGSWEPVIELFEGQGPTWDGIDWYEVWRAAYDNIKLKPVCDENGLPTSGVLIVECGRHEFDSTWVSTQTIEMPDGEWVYSRWACGQYWNSHFWDFETIRPSGPIEVYWGTPGTDFNWTFGPRLKGKPWRRGSVTFNTTREWEYRKATGLRAQIHLTVEDDDEGVITPSTKPRPTVQTDSHGYPDCIVPFDVEVYIRELPPGVEARKLNFQVRRLGKIFIDFGGELFEHPSPQPDAFGQFGLTEKILRENVWVRIEPRHFGAVTGGVWMEDGRKSLSVWLRDGNSIDFPWREIAQAFKHAMPTKLVDYIKALDADLDPNVMLNDKRLKKLWQRVAKGFRKSGRTTPRKKPDPTGPETMDVTSPGSGEWEDVDGRRGPIVNPGETHTSTKTGRTRRPPRKKPETEPIDASLPPKKGSKEPEPPIIWWYGTPGKRSAEDWPVKPCWAVVWDEPSSANDERGKVHLFWDHWYIQQLYNEWTGPDGTHAHAPNEFLGKLRQLFETSVATKIGHRWATERKDARRLGITPQELEHMFLPESLTGYVMGIWDHELRLRRMVGATIEAADTSSLIDDDESDEDADSGEAAS